jgi:group I intron endonuclease
MKVSGIPRKPGIYMILNKENGRFYIGASNNMQQRGYLHISQLNQGKGSNRYLQKYWDKFGRESFEMRVLEISNSDDPDEIGWLEQYWLDSVYSDPEYRRRCYNQNASNYY